MKKSTKETLYAKLTSLALAAGQSKAPRGDNNVVTVEKDAAPPRSTTRTHPTTSTNSFIQKVHTTIAKEQTSTTDTVQTTEPVPDPTLKSIVKKLEFTDEESKHKMQSWGESSDEDDDEDDEDDDDDK